MTEQQSDLPAPYRPAAEAPIVAEFHVSELAAENAGSMSPFGDDIEFPLPPETLGYVHPGPAERPNLAGA
jgi:succinate dehydrogenase / fumarate reductase iron-sulfur subunit